RHPGGSGGRRLYSGPVRYRFLAARASALDASPVCGDDADRDGGHLSLAGAGDAVDGTDLYGRDGGAVDFAHRSRRAATSRPDAERPPSDGADRADESGGGARLYL